MIGKLIFCFDVGPSLLTEYYNLPSALTLICFSWLSYTAIACHNWWCLAILLFTECQIKNVYEIVKDPIPLIILLGIFETLLLMS